MAKDQGADAPTKRRPVKAAKPAAPVRTPAASPAAPVAKAEPKPKVSPQQFFREVRAEARKITWTSWKETWITSVMVFIMVAITSVFFLLVDGSLSFLMQQLLQFAK
jgi:preprotein translocase subunit SecE